MITGKRKAIACVAFLFCSLRVASFASGKTDFQIWNYNTLYGQLNRRVDLFADIEFRYRDNGTTLYYNHSHIELPIHATPFLDIGPAYRQVFLLENKRPHRWVTQFMPNLNLTFFWHLGKYHFFDRSRVSYIIPSNSQPDVWQYRNKLSVYRVLTKRLHELRLFADDEIFFQQKQNGVHENRTTIGFNFGLFRKIRMELAYRYRIVRLNPGWERNNVLMIDFYANF